jgi:hypothetical protein
MASSEIANVKFALTMGEATSVETTAPIRDEIAEYLHEQVHGAITQHLISDSGSSPYQCQGVLVVPSTGNKNQLNSQYGICNPITLLNKLPSKSQQTINNLLTVLPHLNNSHNKDDKIIYDELARELRNEYDYTLKAAYIGEQLIVPPKSKTNGGQPAPRIEQYRWLVRAEIETHTYNAISFPLTVNYDVVVNMQYYDTPFDGDTTSCPSKIVRANLGNYSLGKSIGCSPSSGCVRTGIIDTNGFHPPDSQAYNRNCGTTPDGTPLTLQNLIPSKFVQFDADAQPSGVVPQFLLYA